MKTFFEWIEQAAPVQPGVSPPAHEEGEENMDIKGTIRRRLDMLLSELEAKKKIPRIQMVQLLSQIVAELAGHGMNQQQAINAVKSGIRGQAPAAPAAPPPVPQNGPPMGSGPAQPQTLA
jgi:vancomycin resistance protein YoaR